MHLTARRIVDPWLTSFEGDEMAPAPGDEKRVLAPFLRTPGRPLPAEPIRLLPGRVVDMPSLSGGTTYSSFDVLKIVLLSFAAGFFVGVMTMALKA